MTSPNGEVQHDLLRSRVVTCDIIESSCFRSVSSSSNHIIVIEIIAIFCENSPILRKFDLFDPL